MTKLIIILAIVAGAAIAQAQSNNLFAPFNQSLNLATALTVAQPAPAAPVQIVADPAQVLMAPSPQAQYFIGSNGRMTMAIPLNNSGMYYLFSE
jgi:hypothetical protein